MSQNSPDRLDGLGTRLWDTRPPESLHAALYRSKCRPTVKVAVTGRHLVRRYQLRGASRKSEREVVAGAARMVSAWGACATSSWPIG